MAQAAGHDINYIALAGALAHFGREGGKPTPPINLVGDFGGGGMFMAFGIVCGMLEAQRSGKGQVVDVAMVDGTATLMTMMWGLKQIGFWDEALGSNVLDTGAPFYDTYETSDGKFISLGSLEPQFYAELIKKLGLESEGLPAQMDKAGWDTLRTRFTDLFKTKTRDEWDAILARQRPCTRPCSRCRKRRTTSTSSPARRSSSATACRSPRPRRASRVPQARCSVRRRGRASTPTRRSPIGVSTPPTCRNCARRARSPDRAALISRRRRRRRGTARARATGSSAASSAAVTVTCPTLRPVAGCFAVVVQMRARDREHRGGVGHSADAVHHRTRTARRGRAERQTEHRAQVVLELAGVRAFDGPVPAVVHAGRHLVGEELTVDVEELDAAHADEVE